MDAVEQKIIDLIDSHRDEIREFARDIYTHAELGYKEFRTAAKFTEFSKKLGLRVQENLAITGAKAYLKAGSAVDEHLSDQILLPIALAGDRLPGCRTWGRFTMPKHRSLHFDTNWSVLQQFRDDIEMTVSEVPGSDRQSEITIGKKEV